MSTNIVMPEAGESVVSGVLTAWTRAEGEYVERDDIVAEVETDKITVEILAPAAGTLKQSIAEGEELEIGAVIGEVDESAAKPAATEAPAAASSAAQEGGSATVAPPAPPPKAPAPAPTSNGTGASSGASGGDHKATPLAEKMAAEFGVDLGGVQATGPGGRIREQDVLAAVQSRGATPQATAEGGPPANARGTSVERMSPLRQKIAARLVEAQQTAAMLTTFNEVDMGAVMALRKRYKEPFGEKHGVGLGFMGFFVRAVTKALREYPQINSYITVGDDGKPAVKTHDYCDVAIAVSAPKGLVVPVVRNAETLSFAGIETAIKDLAVRARDNKLELSEMEGGTFTITNGGVFGSLMSTPILNPPQSAILGMHAIKNRAVEYPEKSGQMALRPMMYLALSYDHRIVDGAGAVRFLVSIKESIEDPTRLLLDV